MEGQPEAPAGTAEAGGVCCCPSFCGIPSCALRASWSPEEREAFDLDDAIDEALERGRPMVVAELLSLAPPVERPAYRKRLPPSVGLGTRFGRLEIVGVTWSRRKDGRVTRRWTLRCDCGAMTSRASSDIPGRASNECRACSGRKTGGRNARLIGGKTVAELARIAGTTPEAIRRRHARGWTLEELATPNVRSSAA